MLSRATIERCVACGGGDLRPHWRVLRRCSACGHCVAELDSSQLDISEIYGDSYFVGMEYNDYLRDRSVFRRQFEDRLRDVRRFQKSGDLIEIGCAYGFFLDVARPTFRVRGFDICAGPTRFAREELGLDVQCVDFPLAEADPASADVVAMWDTIEHLPRPDITVQAAIRTLRAGGYIFITTGDVGSLVARLRRDKWRMIHPPSHLHYFSRSSMERLLQRNGVDPVYFRHVGVRRSVAQVAFRLWQVGRQEPSRMYHIIQDSWLGRRSFALNTADIMLMVGRKTGANESHQSGE